jgi:hypothetical protein
MADPTNSDEARAIADSVTIEGWETLMLQLRAVFGQIASESANDMLGALGFKASDDVFSTVAETTLEEAAMRAAELIGKRILDDGSIVDSPNPQIAITDSTRDMLFDTINDGLEGKLSPTAIRDEIMSSYGFSAARALTIARTERSFAQNRGGLTAAKASGVVKTKEWDRGGEQPCDECEDNEGAGAIPLGQDFPSGDPAPPGHPNCVCNLRYGTEAA